jgi:hypothetical protein
MDQDCLIACDHMVGVKVLDGEVVDALLGGSGAYGGYLDPGAGAGLEPGAGLQGGGWEPLAELGEPEGVAVGGSEVVGGGAVGAVDVDGDLDEVSAYDLTCRWWYDLTCR